MRKVPGYILLKSSVFTVSTLNYILTTTAFLSWDTDNSTSISFSKVLILIGTYYSFYDLPIRFLYNLDLGFIWCDLYSEWDTLNVFQSIYFLIWRWMGK